MIHDNFAGIVVGLGVAAGLVQLMHSLLFGVSPFDSFSFAVVPVSGMAAAALASYLPARRTARIVWKRCGPSRNPWLFPRWSTTR